MTLLEVTDLTIRYGKIVAVRSLDLTLEEGEVAVVVGANGAGKSSLLNAISGVVAVASGRVTYEGRDVTGWASHRVAKAGLVQVPEGRKIFAPLSVEDNLLVGGYTLTDRRRRDEILGSIYEMFPVLQERKDAAGGLLSGGEQQMLAFGRALMSDPKLLLLDEPSMGLAPVIVDVVVEAIGTIAARGLSILMVEQNASAAFTVASRAYVLDQGQVVRQGPTETIANDPVVLRAFLGIEPDAELEADSEGAPNPGHDAHA
jgi:branched-chain amino acid transport system ATP-binding protein